MNKKTAFTLAEDTSCHNMLPKMRGFTLAEVLITLGVIGVVAALTIPALVTNIQNKVTEHQRKVANARLVEGLNMLNIKENGLSVRYNNTEEFVRALSKHMKLAQICGSGELDKCFPYEYINYDANGETKQVKVSSLTTASRMKLNDDGWLDPAGFITAAGIPYIISYNNNCAAQTNDNGTTVIDPDRPLKDIPYQCIDGIYDLNGSRTPNKFTKDIESIFAAKIGTNCIKEIGDMCIATKAFIPEPISYADCEANYLGTLANSCYLVLNSSTHKYDEPRNGDRWLGAKVACKEAGGRLPNDTELDALGSLFYKDSSGNHPTIGGGFWANECISVNPGSGSGSDSGGCDIYEYSFDTDLLTELNITQNSYGYYQLWSADEPDSYNGRGRDFYSTASVRYERYRYYSDVQAVCLDGE